MATWEMVVSRSGAGHKNLENELGKSHHITNGESCQRLMSKAKGRANLRKFLLTKMGQCE